MYEEVKSNIINNFLNKSYLNTFSITKEYIIDRILSDCIFPTTYDYDKDILTMNLGNDIVIDFNIKWDNSKINFKKISKIL